MLKLEIDASVIQEALKILNTIAPPLTGNVIISANSDGLSILSIGEANRCILSNLPCRRNGNDIFALPIGILDTAVKGRETLRLTYDNNILLIKSGKYNATLSTVDVIQEESTGHPQELEGITVTVEQSAWLREAIGIVYTKNDGFLNQVHQHVALQLTDDGAFLCCYDGSRLSYAMTDEITGKLDITLPINTLDAVVNTFGMTTFKMAVHNSVLYVWNKVGRANMSILAPTFTVPIPQLLGRIQESRSKPIAMWHTDAAGVKQFMANAKAVTRLDSKNAIQIEVDPKRVHLRVQTTYGKSEVSLDAKANNEAKFEIDYSYFEEFCQRGYETCLLFPTYIAAHQDDTGAIVSLNQSST